MTSILTETASKWGNLYKLRYYLNGRRIPDAEAQRLFEEHNPKRISSERVSHLSGWRSKWKVPA